MSMSSDINRMSVGEIVRKVEMVISLVRVNEFSYGEGIFNCYWFDKTEVFVSSISDECVDLMLFMYNRFGDCEFDKHVKTSLPSCFFLTDDNAEILSYLKEMDNQEAKKEVESDLVLLACNISMYKDFAEEALKRIDKGQDVSSYEYKQSIVKDFVDRYAEEKFNVGVEHEHLE